MVRYLVVIVLALSLLVLQNQRASQPFDQNILIADQGNNRIIEVTPDKQIVWQYTFDNLLPSQGPSSAHFSPDHTKIITSLQNVVAIIDYASRQIVWQYGGWSQSGSDPGHLSGPQDAHILADGNVAVADTKNCRILIISPDKQIVKQYGQTGQCVSQPNNYYFPNDATPISGQRYLITESVGSRITEIDANGDELVSFKSPALQPSKAQLTPRNTILLSDYESNGATIYELNQSADILWQYGPFKTGDGALSSPSFASELPNGNIIVADEYNHRVIVIDKTSKQIVWEYGGENLSLPTSVDWRQPSPTSTSTPIIGTPPAQTPVNTAPGQSATKLRTDLFGAQAALLGKDTATALSLIADAQQLYQQNLAPEFTTMLPLLSSAIAIDFESASKAATSGDATQFTVLRSKLWTEVLQGSLTIIVQSLQHKDALSARPWLLVREFRTPTRISHPSADATLAINQFLHGEQTAPEALLNVRSDLLDTYQSLLNEALINAENAMNNGFSLKWIEQTALAQGYWNILSATYEDQRGPVASRTASDTFSALVQAAASNDSEAFKQARTQVDATLQGFQADPLYQTRQAQHCNQFTALLNILSLEYASGVYTGVVVDELDLQEAIGFQAASVVSFADIKSILSTADSQTIQRLLDTLGTQVNSKVDSNQVDSTISQISDALQKALPSVCQPVSFN